jgi:3-isopropylmalate dehydrogenase
VTVYNASFVVFTMDASNIAEGSSSRSASILGAQRWSDCLHLSRTCSAGVSFILIGVLPGEGIGPEVTGGALEVLRSVAGATGLELELQQGGPIGRDSERLFGTDLSADVVRFCEDIFAQEGAILSGPGGGRYVYDLRKHFDLFLKISPLQIVNGLPDASRLRPEANRSTDILITRENTGGAYQGTWDERIATGGDRVARHQIEYSETEVRRFLFASAKLARSRQGKLTVVWKEAGLPSISRVWRDGARKAAEEFGVRFCMVDIDLLAYRLIHEASAFDVIAAPNLFGDVLADLGASLLGSRGLSFSGNYNARGNAVFQTNHGAADDLAGTDRANPVGQIFSLAMMLRESFGLSLEADAIERAVRSVWRDGWRTEDVAGPSGRVIGTREMSGRVAERAAEIASNCLRASGARSRVA